MFCCRHGGFAMTETNATSADTSAQQLKQFETAADARAWAWASPVTPTQILVLLAFIEYCTDLNADSRATITEVTGLAKSTVNKSIADLKQAGCLVTLHDGRTVTSFDHACMVHEQRERAEREAQRLADLESIGGAA
jgi:biotin operon repressor